jgi:hypothetical protein
MHLTSTRLRVCNLHRIKIESKYLKYKTKEINLVMIEYLDLPQATLKNSKEHQD